MVYDNTSCIDKLGYLLGSHVVELDRREPRLRGYLAGVQDMIFRVRAGRIVKISRADNIRPYKIVLAWNIAIAVCRQYLHLQNPVISITKQPPTAAAAIGGYIHIIYSLRVYQSVTGRLSIRSVSS